MIRLYSIVFSFLGILFLSNCSNDYLGNDTKKLNENASSSGISFSKENSTISFNSKDELKKYMESDEDTKNLDNLSSFYKEGFVPYRPTLNLDEKTYLSLRNKKQEILSKNNYLYLSSKSRNLDNHDDDEDDDFISNDKFASILNAKGEIIVGDSIYRFTPYGRFSSLLSKKNILDNYLKNLSINYKGTEGIHYVTKDIQCFIPKRDFFKHYKIANPPKYSEENSMYSRSLPKNTDNYSSCYNERAPWIDRIFGVSYVCEYKFTSKRKLRSSFSVENFGIYAEAYAQAKFKQKTWFGWYSSRDAEKTYLKINRASLTFESKKIEISKGDVDKALKYYKTISKWFESGGVFSFVNTISTPDDGVTNYIVSKDDTFLNRVLGFPQKVWKQADFSLDVDFGDFISDRTHNIVILSAFDNEYKVSNTQLMTLAFKTLKEKMESFRKRPTAIFLIEHEPNTNEPVSRSYCIFDELHESSGYAIVRKNFHVPEKGSIDNVTVSYSSDLSGNGKFSWSSAIRYPSTKHLDIDLESGAYYNGQWGGSKIKIVYND